MTTTGGSRSGLQDERPGWPAVEHLSAHRVEDEVHQRLGGRVVVGAGGGDELFLYAHSQDAAATAQQSVSELLASHGMQADFTVERWHPVAEEWEPADVPLPDTAGRDPGRARAAGH